MKASLIALAMLATFASAPALASTASVPTAAAPAAAKPTTMVEGPIAEVVARKKEIYVQGADKKYEFYFKPNTELMKDGQSVPFTTLTEGMKVRVTYVTVGKRMDPVKVEILQ